MKQLIISAQKEMIVHSIIILISIVSFVGGCRTYKENTSRIQKDEYDIIEKVYYGDDGLYYKTLSSEQLPLKRKFSYKWINENNVKYNSITEEGRYVNFDTIFSPEKKRRIDYYFKNLESVKLKRSKMSNPEVLSKKQTSYFYITEKQKGFNSVTFPLIVNSTKGVPFGFIYRNSSGLLHIYRKEENSWQEFARVEIHLL